MAYNTKYQIPFTSGLGNTGVVNLKKEDYSGSIITLKTVQKGIRVQYKPGDYFTPIIGYDAVLNLFNDSSTLLGYDDLQEISERQWQITIDISNNTEGIILFDGWLKSEDIAAPYMLNSELNLAATNYVMDLKYTHDPSIDTIDKMSLIDIINHTLCLTGKEDNIYVNNTLCPSIVGYGYPDDQTCLNMVGIDTEAFWEDNYERKDGYRTLEAILKILDSKKYWWNGAWYIERWADIWNEDKIFIEYQPNNSYVFGTVCSSIGLACPSTSFLSIPRFNEIRDNIPELNKIEVEANQLKHLSFIANDFDKMVEWTDDTFPEPTLRQWASYEYDTSLNDTSGNPRQILWAYWPVNNTRGINNGARIGIYNSQFHYMDLDTYSDMEELLHRGISYKFWLTIKDPTTVSNDLTVQFSMANLVIGTGSDPTNENLEKYVCHYYLRVANLLGEGGATYIIKDPVDGWELQNITQAAAVTEIEVSRDNLNSETSMATYSFTIPLSDVTALTTGDYVFVLNIGVPTYKWSTSTLGTLMPQCIVGDFKATISGADDPNITGIIFPNNSLRKKEVKVDVMDADSLNYRNNLFTETLIPGDWRYSDRTSLWGTPDSDETQSLMEWMLYNKGQLFNKNRKRIKCRLISTEFYKPLSLWYDPDDDKLFILVGYTYKPLEDTYDMEFWEYDSGTVVNFLT